jgi:glucosamine-6-phosphate deaminase
MQQTYRAQDLTCKRLHVRMPPMSLQPSTLSVQLLSSRAELGETAGRDVANAVRDAISERGSARVVFAAAPSQSETLESLVTAAGIDWSRVDAFHLDEYVGLAAGAPEHFALWLRRNLFDRLPFRSVNLIDPGADPDREARRYAALLAEGPIDVVVLGIGVNGHLAFNDPPVADFTDPLLVKVVELDGECRRQQVEDECFARITDVPTRAVTLTIPALLSGRRLFCVVPGAGKAAAVRATLEEPLSTAWPSTVLRQHPACTLYLEPASASQLESSR